MASLLEKYLLYQRGKRQYCIMGSVAGHVVGLRVGQYWLWKVQRAKTMSENIGQAAADRKRQFLGVFCAFAATFVFSCQDAITKLLVVDYPIGFIVTLRYWAFVMAGLYMAVRSAEGLRRNLKTHHPALQITRGLLLVCNLLLMGYCFGRIGLADASALFQCSPLIGTVLAFILLREKVGWRRIVALIIGFAGVLVMLRPGSGVFSIISLYVLFAAFSYALYMTLTRLVSGRDSPITSFLYIGMVGSVLMSASMLFFWTQVDGRGLVLLITLCLLSITAHGLTIKALSLVSVVIVQPFTYLALVWSVILGYLIFSELPDSFTIIGAAIVVVSGLFVFHRERVRKIQPVVTL